MPQRSFQVALKKSGLFRIRGGFRLGVGGSATLSSAQLLTVVVVVVLLSSARSFNGMFSHCPVFSILLSSLVTSNGEDDSIGRNGEVDKLNTLTSAEGGGGGGVRGGVKSGSLMVTCSFWTSWVTFTAP